MESRERFFETKTQTSQDEEDIQAIIRLLDGDTADLIIRTATVEDAPKLLAIYAPYVTETAVTFEYDIPTEEDFAGRIRHILQKYPYFVAEQNGEILGYAYAGAFRQRAAYGWAVETSIYIRKDRRKSGLGRALYEALEKALQCQNVLNVYACITCSEEEDPYVTRNSIQFHEHMGYEMVGEFSKCGYKFDRWYSVVWMVKYLGEHTQMPKPVVPYLENRDENCYGVSPSQ